MGRFFLPLLILFGFPTAASGIPLNDSRQHKNLLIEPSDLSALPSGHSPKDKKLTSPPLNKVSSAAFINRVSNQESSFQEGSLRSVKTINDYPGNKVVIGKGNSELYLFEQNELDAQRSGLGIYQILAPMLSPELKKDAKRVWAGSADFRKAFDFSMNNAQSKELILQKSAKETSALQKGEVLESASNKKIYSSDGGDKELDSTVVRALFDDFYDLLKNAFFIIAGILLAAKIISLLIKKITKDGRKRKKRKKRYTSKGISRDISGHSENHSKRRRKKRRRSHA